MSSTPVTTDTHIARTFSPSCSPPEVCAKVCHWRSFRWLISILQSAVSIAAAETHASNGSSHRRMKVRTIAPPAPVRSLVCRFRRTCSRRERLRSISDRNRLLSSASSAAHAVRASPCAGMKKAAEDRDKCQRRDEGTAQRIEQAEAVDIRKLAGKYPAGVLPIAADPAVLALEIGKRLIGKGVGKLGVAHVRAAQIGAPKCVMGEDAPIREAPCRAAQQRLGIDEPLCRQSRRCRKRPYKAHRRGCNTDRSRRPRQRSGKVRGVCALKLRLYPRVDDRVTRNDHI